MSDGGKKKPFKFFNMWTKVNDFQLSVSKVWQTKITGTPMFRVVRKLKLLKPALKGLNKDLFSDIERNADVAHSMLNDCQLQLRSDSTNSVLMDKERQVRESYQLLASEREDYMQQKAKCEWAKGGEANTVMFHQDIRQRQIHNKVLQIENNAGVECKDPNEILQAFLDYYENLLGTRAQTSDFHRHILAQRHRIAASEWDHMCAIPSEEEISQEVFCIPNDKSPNPDGYTSCFFKASWDIIKNDVCHAVKDFFENRRLLKQLNSTTLVLIPKVDNPRSIKEFKPIACCNTLYKVISKLLCKRISGSLPQIINPAQCAFIQGRSILGNILISQDLVRLYTKSVSPRCLMKVELSKAYDSIEWVFVEQMLNGLNIPPKLIKLIIWLRQGDPMSPLMFTVCMEYLSRLLQLAGDLPGFHFHTLCKNIKLNHLMFADDLLLFCKGDVRMLKRIRGWNSRKISYAGRLILVKVVLSTIHTYWSQIFVLPMGVIDRIQALCKNFLWDGEDKYSKAPLVALNVVCKGKHQGGLGIIDSRVWNIAAIENGYEWLMVAPSSKVPWCKVVWNRYSVPKWEFILWLIQHQRLLTLDRLKKMGMDVSEDCFLCGLDSESHLHLFQKCSFTQNCLQLVADWLHIHAQNLLNCVSLLRLRCTSILIRQISVAVVVGVYYWI
ncbi:uncharacterized protein LOC141607886 [Silene latifolia]|uniref:uncharacterized protein LOC141607886 n=1 Tax=Silene latifolia TaxID=37657 RepID=UPI003D77833F